MSDLVRVKLRRKSAGLKAGEALVVSQEEADRLVANGHATITPYQPKSDEDEAEPKGKAKK